ncbi:MAG: oligosaccharide flippase family protein [Anaerolineales bacterium]|nr:oligosaccharide flippase family protein [Anaerolineales bacterium]
MSLASRAASSAVFLGASTVINIGIGFVSSIVLARLLQPNDFGTFALVVTLFAFADIRVKLQLDQKFLRDQDDSAEYLDAYFTLNFALACVSLIVVSGGAVIAVILNRTDLAICLFAFSALGLIDPLTSTIRVSIEKKVAFRAISLIQLLAAVTLFVVTLITAWLGLGLWSLLLGTGASTLVSAGLFWRIAPRRPKWRVDMPLARAFLGYGLRYGLVYAVSAIILTQFDNFIIGLMMGTYALGFYDRAYRTSLWPTLLVSAALGRISLPAYAQLQNEPDRLSRAFSIVLWLVLTCATPIALLVLVTAPELVPILYGEKWLPSVPILQVLAAFAVCRPLWDNMVSILIATKRPGQMARLAFIQAVVLIVLAVPLTQLLGSVGTAMSVGVAFLISAVFLFYFGGKYLSVALLKNIGLPLFNNLATVMIYYVLVAMLPLGSLALWVRLGMEAILFLGVYVVLTGLTSRQTVAERARYILQLARG